MILLGKGQPGAGASLPLVPGHNAARCAPSTRVGRLCAVAAARGRTRQPKRQRHTSVRLLRTISDGSALRGGRKTRELINGHPQRATKQSNGRTQRPKSEMGGTGSTSLKLVPRKRVVRRLRPNFSRKERDHF